MKLRIIPTKTHGAIDMATGPALIASPTLLRMNGNTGATIPPRVVGALATANALLTDYEFGLKRVVPMRAHLALDALGGVALAVTPFLTGASKKGLRHWLPHTIIGANEVFLRADDEGAPAAHRPAARVRAEGRDRRGCRRRDRHDRAGESAGGRYRLADDARRPVAEDRPERRVEDPVHEPDHDRRADVRPEAVDREVRRDPLRDQPASARSGRSRRARA